MELEIKFVGKREFTPKNEKTLKESLPAIFKIKKGLKVYVITDQVRPDSVEVRTTSFDAVFIFTLGRISMLDVSFNV